VGKRYNNIWRGSYYLFDSLRGTERAACEVGIEARYLGHLSSKANYRSRTLRERIWLPHDTPDGPAAESYRTFKCFDI
jgi:hypothetical protein